MSKLEGKVALVTGGNSGIGLATAREFVGEGAYVLITGRRESQLAAAIDETRNICGVQGDVSNSADLDRLFSQVKSEKESSTSSSQTLVLQNTRHSARSPKSITIRFSTLM